MKEINDCNIVQDLLPNYIDKLTSEKTNQYIEEHLQNCNKCKEVLNDMKKEIVLNVEKINKKTIYGMKKINKKMRFFKFIILIFFILIAIFLISSIRKFIIISSLENIASKNIYDNYVEEIYAYDSGDEDLRLIKSYNIGEKFYTIANHNIKTLIFYTDGNEKIEIMQTNGYKVAMLSQQMFFSKTEVIDINYIMNNFNKLKLSFTSKISSDNCNGIECYLIELEEGHIIWVDKQTGIVVREINVNMVRDYNYQFDIVKDSDIIKPNVLECDEII